MKVTIELSPEVEQWVSTKLQAGEFATPADFVTARLAQDWLEEKIEEPASPLTAQDWAAAREALEQSLQKRQ